MEAFRQRSLATSKLFSPANAIEFII